MPNAQDDGVLHVGTESMMSGGIKLWHLRLDRPAEEVERATACLSAPELARAAKFRDPRLAARSMICRAELRRLIAARLGCAARDLEFTHTPFGKPMLVDSASHQLHFNVTHSADRAIIGLRHGAPLGIDLERLRPGFATEDVARRFFASGEIAALQRLPPSERVVAFFRCWTRKEAFIKAVGEGLSYPLDEFEVNIAAGAGTALVSIRKDSAAGREWTLRELEAPPGFVAAVAARGPVPHLVVHSHPL